MKLASWIFAAFVVWMATAALIALSMLATKDVCAQTVVWRDGNSYSDQPVGAPVTLIDNVVKAYPVQQWVEPVQPYHTWHRAAQPVTVINNVTVIAPPPEPQVYVSPGWVSPFGPSRRHHGR